MDLGLTGRTALVLGASRGLGAAIARTLAAEGVAVIVCGRREETLASVVAAIAAEGGAASTRRLDLADPDSVDALLDGLTGPEGGTPIDILVNNSGGPPPGPVATMDRTLWQGQFATMVSPLFAITGRLLPGMRARGFGRVITVVSSGVEQPIPNLGLSNALRASIVGWAKTLAAEVAAEGVTVNCVVPGRIQTARLDEIDAANAARTGKTAAAVASAARAAIPMGRYGDPQEFADAVAFLASRRASYITGSLLRVDGGLIQGI